ncbi:unnamed protein product, partial [Brenthis ino]
MEHIRQFDWCYSQPDVYFLKESDLDNSVTEKILRNKFHNPMVSSESEDEQQNINWAEVFSKKEDFSRNNRVFVPCMPKFMQYPKLSALTSYQHFQCIKVLCSENPHILPEEFMQRPTKNDYKVFEELKPIYEKEQKEFIEWAKTQWTTIHCIRALRPKPPIEFVYDARFKMRENEMQSYPKMFDMAAQIPLETRNNNFDLVLSSDLKSVDIKLLPQIECRNITKKLTIMKQCAMPEPCNKHPCRFILPNEKAVSILPLIEIQRELAQFTLDNDAQYIASENSLKCLMELDRCWDITVSVVPVIGPDGESTNVVVLGDEFCINRESPVMRTYKAFKHLLEHTLVPPSERSKLQYKDLNDNVNEELHKNVLAEDTVLSSDDEDADNLCIVEDSEMAEDMEATKDEKKEGNKEKTNNVANKSNEDDQIGFYSCTCKDTMFERPPPRSFQRWQVRNKTTGEHFNIVVHSPHKVRDKRGEVLLEPIPEYQIELGASAQSKEKIQSLALSLMLRKNATLINVRVDGATGEVATFENMNSEEFKAKHGDLTNEISNTLHTAFNQLQGLLPGNYILRHEPNHGHNAILYVSKPSVKSSLVLEFDSTQLAEVDEAKNLKTPPVIIPVLLPYHKLKRMLPCAFTPHERQLARSPRRAPRRQRTPPRALQLESEAESGGAQGKWPKRKKKKKKN